MKLSPIVFLVVMSVAVVGALEAQNKKVTLTSLEWAPYTTVTLADQGASSAVAIAAFKAMGYDLTINFLPWNRAVSMAKNDDTVAGYFPEYYTKDNAKDFLYSQPIGKGPLGFVERKASPIKWKTLDDLADRKIGVVDGYINTDDFDARVAARSLKVEKVSDDATNVVKVANGRIALAVIDLNVLSFLVYRDKVAIPYRGQVQPNAQILEDKALYVCFKKGADGDKLSKLFNEGLTKINVNKIMKDSLSSIDE